MNILVTTMGASWQILPEITGFTNPGAVDLFRFHSGLQEINRTKQKYNIVPADEIWVISSCGSKSEESIQAMLAWYDALNTAEKPVLRIWKIKYTDALASEKECRIMAEGIHTIVCCAAEETEKGRLMLSLTGGRKTMSTDLQQAAAWFGCDALIHIVDNPALTSRFNSGKWGINKFTIPLPEHEADTFTPFCLGNMPRSPLADLKRDSGQPCPVIMPENKIPCLYEVDKSLFLTRKIEDTKAKAGFLMSNYSNKILQGEKVTNFLALYSLPEQIISKLKKWKFGLYPEHEQQELAILKKLPKTELHCHLGGIANVHELITIADSVRQDIERHRRYLEPHIKKWTSFAETKDPDLILKKIGSLKSVRNVAANVSQALCTAAFILVFENDPDLLHQVIFGRFTDPEKFCAIEFGPYERIGDLQGSGLLTHKNCLETACRIIAEKAIEHNVQYMEIRCSPVKYAGKNQSAHDVYNTISKTFSEFYKNLKISLIFTASRHGEKQQIKQHVNLAKEIVNYRGQKNNNPVCLRGFDLAGDEKVCAASAMQKHFLPLMKECMHFTIHAGENSPVESIWEAVYHLSAQRIGHGLTLKDNPALMEKFIDSNIVLEMCPSSNFQIAGFKDNYFDSTCTRETYPLKQYLYKGLTVTVNTDNPGISDTDFTKELHRACRLTPEGLSMWEILSIIRNGFKGSFAVRSVRNELLKKAEQNIVELLPDFKKYIDN